MRGMFGPHERTKPYLSRIPVGGFMEFRNLYSEATSNICGMWPIPGSGPEGVSCSRFCLGGSIAIKLLKSFKMRVWCQYRREARQRAERW